MLPEVLRLKDQEQRRQQKFGHVRGIISTTFQGSRVVGVGTDLFYSKEWRTFIDFLFDYIHRYFTRGWADAQTELGDPRHPVLGWAEAGRTFRSTGEVEPDGTRSGVPTGEVMALLLLSYDLFVLHGFQLVHQSVLGRLLRRDQFQGARYELAVAATMIRADCTVELEDETDKTKKHHEFECGFRPTDERIAVEAKSKHRHGVLGFAGGRQKDPEAQRAGFRRLLSEAIGKPTDLPRIVFVELNLPTSVPKESLDRWERETRNIISSIERASGGVTPWSLLVLTNMPHHYASGDQPTPRTTALMHIPENSEKRLSDEAVRGIQIALDQSDDIPNWFDDDDNVGR